MQRDERGDAELIVAVRGGDIAAFDVLYSRHRARARTFARTLTASSPIDADDLVGDAFLKVLSALTRGYGPTGAFWPYLLATIRSTFADESRYRSIVRATEDLEECLPEIRGADPAVWEDRSYAAAAFTALPERWQAVLWHLDVEGEPPRTIAARLGVSAGAVSSLATRAREGLRRGYLQAHLRRGHEHPVECDYVLTRLAGWTRTKPGSRADDRIGRHLRTCASCRAMAADLREVNSSIGATAAPAALGAATLTYLLAGTAAASGGGLAGGAWLAATKAKVVATAIAWLTALGVVAATPVPHPHLPVPPSHPASTSAAPSPAPVQPDPHPRPDPRTRSGRPADQPGARNHPVDGELPGGVHRGRIDQEHPRLGGIVRGPGSLVTGRPPGQRRWAAPDTRPRLWRRGDSVTDDPWPPVSARRPAPDPRAPRPGPHLTPPPAGPPSRSAAPVPGPRSEPVVRRNPAPARTIW